MNQEVGKNWDTLIQKEDIYCLKHENKRFFENFIKSEFIRKIVYSVPITGEEKILEAGCGSGKFSIVLAILGCEVTAMDYSAKIVKNVEGFVKIAETYFGKLRVNVEQGNIEAMKYEDNCFDVVFNVGVVEHWLDDSERIAVIREMVRVVRPRGEVVIMVPNGKHPFHNWWVFSKYPGYTSAPPMFNYNTDLLKRDMEKAGLKDIQTDGLDAYTSICQWPDYRILKLTRGGLKRILPPPKFLRELFGVTLFAVGKKGVI